MTLLALLLAVAAGTAAAQPTVPPVVLCTTDFPPYVSADLPDGGRITALARRAFAQAGLAVQTEQLPWVRAFALAKSGGCLLLTLWRNEERDALFHYSLPVARMELGLFVRGDRQKPLPPDATVAYQRGSYLPQGLTAGRYRLHELLDPRVGLEMLKRGRVDAVFSERETMEHLLRRQPDMARGIRWQAPALEVKATHMALSKQHPQADAWREYRTPPYVVSGLFANLGERAFFRRMQHQARVRVARVGLALLELRQTTGAWPESLDAVIPMVGAEWVEDPFTGERLQYEPGVRLEAAVPIPNEDLRADDEIVWRFGG